MGVTNLYSNLPGHLVEFKDGGLQLTSSTTDTSSTKSLLILGTATDGPINEPVKIDAVTVSQVFGKEVDAEGYPNGATLTKYAKQAFKNGFDDVRCMRVTGSQAYTTLYGQQTTGYEDATAEVNGADAADGTGVITGNAEFNYNFTTEQNCFLLEEGNGFTLNGQSLEWGDARIVASSFAGFQIRANAFSKVETFTLNCKAMNFLNASGEAGISNHVEETATVADDGEGGVEAIEITSLDRKSVV